MGSKRASKKAQTILTSIFIFLVISGSRPVLCNVSDVRASNPDITVALLVRSIEKIDLSESIFKIDFYLIISADLRKVNLIQLKQFEFVNGEPTIRTLEENVGEDQADLVYRVKGDFIASYNLGLYPFDYHNIEVILDFSAITTAPSVETLLFGADDMIVVGWENEGIDASVTEYTYLEDQIPFPRIILSTHIRRPLLSSILKNVLPITVIAAIAMLTFLISVNDSSQRIGLGVSTLLSATAFHLSLLGNIPPTSVFTIADGIMLAVYLLHFYSLSVSVFLMKLVERGNELRANQLNKKAIIFLPLVIIIPIITAILINRQLI